MKIRHDGGRLEQTETHDTEPVNPTTMLLLLLVSACLCRMLLLPARNWVVPVFSIVDHQVTGL